MTILDLIKRSMRLLGVLNIGTPPTAEEEQDGLEALNSMVDSWALQRLMIYTTLRQLFTCNAGQQVYEIGPNAVDWVAQRPVYLDGAGVLFGPNGSERPIEIYTPAEWQAQRSKGLVSNVVMALIYDYGFSNPNSNAVDVGSAKITVWPAPSGAESIALYVPQAVSEFTSINQRLALPPGYKRALAYNHAIEFAAEFEVEPSAAVVAIAAESLANVQRANVHLNPLRCDPSYTRSGRFNIFIGE